jgi:hypothetical protein
MQAGYDPAEHRTIGTPLDPELRKAIGPPRPASATPCFPDTNEGRLVKALWADPTLQVNSKLAAFAKQPTVLQGIVLTNPPTGGFGPADKSVIVTAAGIVGAAAPDTIPRLDCSPGAYFMQPGYPDRTVEVGPADALKVSGTQPPFRDPCGKHRSARGHMSVAGVEAEIQARKVLAQQTLDAMDPPLEEVPANNANYEAVHPAAAAANGTIAYAAQRRAQAQPHDMRTLEVLAGSGQVALPCTASQGAWDAMKTALRTWGNAIASSPSAFVRASTWTTDDVWVCLLLIVLLIIGFALFLALFAHAVQKSKKRASLLASSFQTAL